MGQSLKKNFVPLIKDLSIKLKITTVKNPQSNNHIYQTLQVMRHMLLTKNLQGKVLDYIDPFGSILSSIAWTICSSYNNTTDDATPAQVVLPDT